MDIRKIAATMYGVRTGTERTQAEREDLLQATTKKEMTIIEQKTEGKAGRLLNEDGITADDNFVAVVDGSTSKTELRVNPEMSNGRYCMLAIIKAIKKMPRDICMERFCEKVTEEIRSIYNAHAVDIQKLNDVPTNRMTASAIVFSLSRKEIWMVGDCQCLVDGKLYENPKPGEKEIAAQRALIIRKSLKEGMSEAEMRRNDIGRKVIDGFNIPTHLVKVIPIDDKTHEIVLASDGYPKLMPTLNESEAELQRLLEEDPLCIYENIATKGLNEGQTSFDDRSYIRFRI